MSGIKNQLVGILKSTQKSEVSKEEILHLPKKDWHVHFELSGQKRIDESDQITNGSSIVTKEVSQDVIGARFYQLALVMESTANTRNDIFAAIDLYMKAVKFGHLDAIFRVGKFTVETELLVRSVDTLDIALEYFEKIRMHIDYAQHDAALDYIQAIYLEKGEMYEQGVETEINLKAALECYEMVPLRTQAVQNKIKKVTRNRVIELLSTERKNLDGLEEALNLLTTLDVMGPEDASLKRSIHRLTFEIGELYYKGTKISGNLQKAYEHLEYLYAEVPEYPGLCALLKKVMTKGILPEGYADSKNLKPFRASQYFLQFVFKKAVDQEVIHDSFLRNLIKKSVTKIVEAHSVMGEEGIARAASLLKITKEGYDA